MLGRFRILSLLEWALIALLAALVVAVFVNVALRLLFHSGIAATEELSRVMLVWLVMLGAVLALARRAHIAMDAVVRRLPAPLQFVAALGGLGLMMLCDALLLAGAWRQYQYSAFDSFPITGLPVGLVYQAGIAGAVLFLLISGLRVLGLLTGRLTAGAYFEQHRTLPEGDEEFEPEGQGRA